MKILVPTICALPEGLPDGVHAVHYDNRQPIPDEHTDAEVLVVWGMSAQRILDDMAQLPKLRLVQGLMAGVDHQIAESAPDGVAIASGVGLHTLTVTEHALTLLLTLVRRMPQMAAAQQRHEWSPELGGVQPLHPDGQITTLIDAKVVIWGFGAIGQHLAGVLRELGAHVTGVARSAGERNGFPVVTEDDLPELLPGADALILILPASPATDCALDAATIALLSPDALVVNVGRGTTIDTEALADALDAGRLAGAALDVTPEEPLPSGSRLWTTANLVITPHAAGGRPVGAQERIATNVANLLAGRPLVHPVTR